MTERQRDLLTLYFIHIGITDPRKMKFYIKDYMETRDIVSLCCEELSNDIQEEDRD